MKKLSAFLLVSLLITACTFDTAPESICVDNCLDKGYTQAACEKSCALTLDPDAPPDPQPSPYEICRSACIDKGGSSETCALNCEHARSLPDTSRTCIQNCAMQSPDVSSHAACIQNC